MYKQTIPIPSLFTNESACFTAACSALFSVFVLFLAYPTCSLYPPHVLSISPRFPFPGPFAPPLLSSHLGQLLAVPPPLSSLCSRKPSVLSVFLLFFFSGGVRYHKFFILFYLEACSRPVFLLLGTSHAKGPPCFRWHQSTVNLDSSACFVHISLRLISRSILLSFFSSFHFSSFPRPQCKSTSCYQSSQ